MVKCVLAIEKNCKVSTLLYSDDFFLMAENENDLQKMLF